MKYADSELSFWRERSRSFNEGSREAVRGLIAVVSYLLPAVAESAEPRVVDRLVERVERSRLWLAVECLLDDEPEFALSVVDRLYDDDPERAERLLRDLLECADDGRVLCAVRAVGRLELRSLRDAVFDVYASESRPGWLREKAAHVVVDLDVLTDPTPLRAPGEFDDVEVTRHYYRDGHGKVCRGAVRGDRCRARSLSYLGLLRSHVPPGVDDRNVDVVCGPSADEVYFWLEFPLTEDDLTGDWAEEPEPFTAIWETTRWKK